MWRNSARRIYYRARPFCFSRLDLRGRAQPSHAYGSHADCRYCSDTATCLQSFCIMHRVCDTCKKACPHMLTPEARRVLHRCIVVQYMRVQSASSVQVNCGVMELAGTIKATSQVDGTCARVLHSTAPCRVNRWKKAFTMNEKAY